MTIMLFQSCTLLLRFDQYLTPFIEVLLDVYFAEAGPVVFNVMTFSYHFCQRIDLI